MKKHLIVTVVLDAKVSESMYIEVLIRGITGVVDESSMPRESVVIKLGSITLGGSGATTRIVAVCRPRLVPGARFSVSFSKNAAL